MKYIKRLDKNFTVTKTELNEAKMEKEFAFIAARVKEHDLRMKIANELFPKIAKEQKDGKLVNFIPLSQKQRDQVYDELVDRIKDALDESVVTEQMDLEDELANEEFGMDFDQLGSKEKEWVRDEMEKAKGNFVKESVELNEAVVNNKVYVKAGKLGYNDQFLGRRSLAWTLAVELGLQASDEFVGPWLGFDHKSMYAIGKKGGTILDDALTNKYTYEELKKAAADFLGIK